MPASTLYTGRLWYGQSASVRPSTDFIRQKRWKVSCGKDQSTDQYAAVQTRERPSAHLGKERQSVLVSLQNQLDAGEKKNQTRLKSIKSSTFFVRNVVKYGIIPDHHQCKTEHSTHQ